jgi:hypothetical protein
MCGRCGQTRAQPLPVNEGFNHVIVVVMRTINLQHECGPHEAPRRGGSIIALLSTPMSPVKIRLLLALILIHCLIEFKPKPRPTL